MIATHTETHPLVAGVSQSYGSIVPQFDYLDVFVDFGGEVGNLTVQIFVQNGAGGVNTLVASRLVGRKQNDPNSIIAIPKIGIIGSTQYFLVLTGDVNFTAVKATMAGFNDQVNNQPNETVTTTLPLVQGIEVSFGFILNYHINIQAEVDFGPNNGNLDSIWRLYGTSGLGGVRVVLFERRISANPNNVGRIQLIINSDAFQTVGCDNFELTAQALFPIIPTDSHPTATLVGFDPNIDIITGGGGGGPPTGPAGGYLGGTYPNPVVIASPTLVYRPGAAPSSNVYPTWPALMAAFALTTGPVNIALDDSIVSPVTFPVGTYDFQGRVTVTGPGQQNSNPINVNVQDGVVFQDSFIWQGPLNVQFNPSIAPALTYTGTQAVTAFRQGMNVRNVGVHSLVDVPGGNTHVVAFFIGSSYDSSPAGGPIMDLQGPGSTGLVVVANDIPANTSVGPLGFVTGVIGSNLVYVHGAGWRGPQPPALPGFFGNYQDQDFDLPASNVLTYFPGSGLSFGKIFSDWNALYNNGFQSTDGPVTIAVNDSLAPATVPNGFWDFQGRATLVSSSPKQNPQTTLNIPEGVTVGNLKGIDGLQLLVTPTATPSLAFNGNIVFLMKNGAIIANRGTIPVINVAPGSAVNVLMAESSNYDNSLAPFAPFAQLNGPGTSFSITSITGAGLSFPPNNTVIGPPGSSVVFQYDASWQGDPTLLGYTGALLTRTIDQADFVSYVDTVPLLGSTNVQGAIDALKNRPVSPTLVFQPGGVAGGNVYTSWPALMTDFGLTKGPIEIAIDASFSGGTANIPVGIWDLQSRGSIINAIPGFFTTVNIVDGAQLKNHSGIINGAGLAFQGNGTVLNPFIFDASITSVISSNFAPLFENKGPKALITWINSTFFAMEFFEALNVDVSAVGAGAFVDVPPGSEFDIIVFSAASTAFFIGTNSLFSGPLGTTLKYFFDSSWNNDVSVTSLSPAFLGTTTEQLTTFANTVQYIVNSVGPIPTSVATAQTAIDAHQSPQRTVAGNYVIDSLGFDQTIFSQLDGANITLPSAAAWPGREITVKDVSPLISVAPYFNLVPTGADNIEDVNAPYAVNIQRQSLTVKSDGVNNWWII